MKTFLERLKTIFTELDQRIEVLAKERAEVRILGQMSLLANDKLIGRLSLADTAELDAHLRTEYVVERELREILKNHGFVYDETSNEIWIPTGTVFEPLFDFKNLVVTRIDSESALVSKAVKARKKNKILVRQALASKAFPHLADRIQQGGGEPSYFLDFGGPNS